MMPTNFRAIVLFLGSLGVLILSMLGGFAVAQSASTDFEEVITDSSVGVIVPVDQVAALLEQCSRRSPKNGVFLQPSKAVEFWRPSKEDILRLEKALPGYLKDYQQYCDVSFSKSKRQYGGIIIAGRKIIYVNAFGGGHESYWKDSPVNVCDGGCKYWGIEFDVESGEFSNLDMNGGA